MMDAIYLAVKGDQAKLLSKLMASDISVYVLKGDMERRGLNSYLMKEVELLDYGGFIKLTLEEGNRVVNL
jgi:sulfur relay protein TusB/DsrH